MKSLDVLTPTYRRSAALATLTSVAMQTLTDFRPAVFDQTEGRDMAWAPEVQAAARVVGLGGRAVEFHNRAAGRGSPVASRA